MLMETQEICEVAAGRREARSNCSQGEGQSLSSRSHQLRWEPSDGASDQRDRGRDAVRQREQDCPVGSTALGTASEQKGAPFTIDPQSDQPGKSLTDAEIKLLKNQTQKHVEDVWWSLVCHGRRVLLEVCCEPDSVLSEQCIKKFGPESATRVAHWNGGDIETPEGIAHVKQLMLDQRPLVIWISPECGPYSPMQHLNQKSSLQKCNLEEKRRKAVLQYEGASELAQFAHSLGISFVIELSERCEAWSLDWALKLKETIPTFSGVCKGCQVGLKDHNGHLLGKGWRLCSNNEELVRHMSLKCSNNHTHAPCEGSKTCRSTAFYPQGFVNRVLEHIQVSNQHGRVLLEVQDGFSNDGPSIHEQHDLHCEEKDHEGMVFTMTREEVTQIMNHLRRIHTATGHCSREYLVKALKKRNVKPDILTLARSFHCPTCHETKATVPRNKSTLVDIPPKWATLQGDCGDWQHPDTGVTWQFILGIDEGCRFRVAKILGSGKKMSPSAQDLIDFYEAHWLPYFGKPKTIRVDPAGAFRSRRIDEYFLERQVIVETIPAEAHWQIPLVERSIQTTKGMLTKLSKECPEMRFEELLSRVVWAQNTHDQYLGFSPLQHAFGRNPDMTGHLGPDGLRDPPVMTESGISAEFGRDVKAMIHAEQAFLEEQAKARLSRAMSSGSRSSQVFQPGDLVYYFRRQVPKSLGSNPFQKGCFLGPARVLATETRKEPDGSKRPGSCVWLYRGDRLIKAAPQQLRFASDREEAFAELEQPHKPLSWTISDTTLNSKRKVYDDISLEWEEHQQEEMNIEEPEPSLEAEDEEMYDERMKSSRPAEPGTLWEPPTKRAHRKTPGVKRGAPPPPSAEDDMLLALASETPSQHLQQEEACISIAIDLPDGKAAQKKGWIRDFDAFLVNQVKKNHIEVTERRLSEEDRKLFDKAKEVVEIKNFILAKVFEKLPPDAKPDRQQAVRMRWVLTWKINPETHERKAKARAVILGYLDPDYERRPSASPTVSRTSRQLFLQCAASFGFSIEKGDVSGAFLQGRRFNREVLCEPLPEICDHLQLPRGSLTRLTKAAYGLVEAPIEWYLTINEFLESIGLIRQWCDPCVWSLFDENRQPIGYVCGHVDDFLFAGKKDDNRWTEVTNKIKEQFKWGEWEKDRFTQCGVLIESLDTGGFALSQPDFASQIEEINIPPKRWKEPEAPITPSERQQMRSVLGALSWHGGQMALDLCPGVNLLLSKANTATVQDLVETNKLLKKAKAKKGQKLIIHPIAPSELLVAAWTDAAHANRTDGSSTKGIFIGCSSQRLMDGELERVSPVYWTSAKISRVCRSSASAETRAAVDAEDILYSVRFQLSEFLGNEINIWDCDSVVNQVPCVLVCDSKNVYDRLSQTMLTLRGAEKRSDLETLCLKEATETATVQLRWVNGESQLANSLTKPSEPHQIFLFLARNCRWRIVYDPELMSGRKRKSLGLGSLDGSVAIVDHTDVLEF